MLPNLWMCASVAATLFPLYGWAAAPASFNSPQIYMPAGSGVVAADFNRDGNLDLAVLADMQLVILAGSGKDTFHLLAEYSLPNELGGVGVSLAAGDFNGDGKLDLVASTTAQPTILRC